MLHTSEAILAVRDVRKTIRFYREALGFESEWLWQDPPTFGGVHWGKVEVMFCLDPELAEKVEGHMHFFRVENVEDLYEKHKSSGAPIVGEIENKPWGVREYTVRDPNGYHLRFAGHPKYERPVSATNLIPEYIRIERRNPTVQEHQMLFLAVGWNNPADRLAESLGRSLICVVAIDSRDDSAVGMARACGDGYNFTIWDVIVVPAHQGQKIGSALIEATLKELRTIARPGSFVGLFTGKPEFYERVGFKRDHGMHLRL